MSATDYTEDVILDLMFGSGHDAAFGATVYLGLFTVLPADDGTGGTAPSGGSYARVAITNDNTNFPAASGGSKSNGVRIDMPTATGSWGTIVGWGLYSASSGGTLYVYGDLATPRPVVSADAPFFPAGALNITCE